jgi:FKBP-type peptidyl-prolyl cis-trans isomerase FkpA
VLVGALIASTGCDFGHSSLTSPDQSSVQYSQVDLTVGTGAPAVPGSTVTIQYGLWLYSDTAPDHKGTQVDAQTTSFVVGAGTVIKGLDQGIQGMLVGGTRRLIIPPSLAFGATGNGSSIPSNAAVVLDIALTTVQ